MALIELLLLHAIRALHRLYILFAGQKLKSSEVKEEPQDYYNCYNLCLRAIKVDKYAK